MHIVDKCVSFFTGYCSIQVSTLHTSLILETKVIPSFVFKAMRVVILLLLANVFAHAFVPGLHKSMPIRKANWLLPNNGESKVIKKQYENYVNGEAIFWQVSVCCRY